jgi:RES domain
LPHKRARSDLAHPPDDLRAFPSATLRAGSELHRIHSAAMRPWYFNAEDTWRFNPCAAPGLGACYLAERPVAGLLEIYKGLTVVAEQDVATKRHFSAALRDELRLADLCAPAAHAFGVNGEVHTTTDYALTQAWAAALAQAGFAGVRYLCRSDPGMRLVGYALFDRAGEAPAGRWPEGHDRAIGEDVLREAEEYGLRVRPTP